MTDKLKNDNWDKNIPSQLEENSGIPEINKHNILIHHDLGNLDVEQHDFDLDILRKSNLPDFEYDFEPPNLPDFGYDVDPSKSKIK